MRAIAIIITMEEHATTTAIREAAVVAQGRIPILIQGRMIAIIHQAALLHREAIHHHPQTLPRRVLRAGLHLQGAAAAAVVEAVVEVRAARQDKSINISIHKEETSLSSDKLGVSSFFMTIHS